MCGRIWTPPFCNALVKAGLAFTATDVYPASKCGPQYRRREPRWISARFSLIGSKASAFALPVHISGLRSYGTCHLTISYQVAAILSGMSSYFRSILCSFQTGCGVSGPL